MDWREIAFNYSQVEDFLSIVALPHWEVSKLLPFDSRTYRCFCAGFYFFAWSIKEELAPSLAEELLNLATRIEQLGNAPANVGWDSAAADARRLLEQYFNRRESSSESK